MKKKNYFCHILSLAVALLLLVGCQNGKYKRINLQGEMLGSANEILAKTIDRNTDIEKHVDETYPDKMSVYKITPREISLDEFKTFAEHFGVNDPIIYGGDFYHIGETASQGEIQHNFILEENEISYDTYVVGGCTEEMTQTDEELEQLAREIFESLPLIEGEYEYLGETSTQTVSSSKGEYVAKKRVSFRRLLDNMRVIGNDICDLYFTSNGLDGIELRLYSYEKIDEVNMISLDDAIKKIKTPDAFSLSTKGENTLQGKAETLSIERTKLLWVNQYIDGCEILQPVYNLMGTATNENGSAEFSAKIIAIPEKYTYK